MKQWFSLAVAALILAPVVTEAGLTNAADRRAVRSKPAVTARHQAKVARRQKIKEKLRQKLQHRLAQHRRAKGLRPG